MDAVTLYLLAQQAAQPPPAAYTDTTTPASGNVTSPALITAAWATPSAAPVAGTVYTLDAELGGQWGAELCTFYADINGSFTSLATVGAALGSSGDNLGGWARLTVRVVSATACRLHIAGMLVDLSLNSGHMLSGSGAPLSCAPVTGVTFAGGDTIGLAVAFGASASGQTISTGGSTFTRYGPQ